MTDNVTIKLRGIDKAVMEVRGWRGRLGQALHRVVSEYTLLIEAEVKTLAPVDTGRLRASVHHDIKKELVRIVGRVLSGTDYDIHQEFGTRFQPGKPHFRPAFEKYRDPFVRAIEEALRNTR